MIYIVQDATNYPVEVFRHKVHAVMYVMAHQGCRIVCLTIREGAL